MLQRLRILLLLAGFGFVSTMMVAWGLSLFRPLAGVPLTFQVVIDRHAGWQVNSARRVGAWKAGWFANFWREPGMTDDEWMEYARSNYSGLPANTAPVWRGSNAGTPFNGEIVEQSRGWPFLCVWCVTDGSRWDGAIALKPPGTPTQSSPLSALPYKPLWPGLLGNTVFYTLLSALGMIGYTRVQRRRRRCSGCCVKCGYDLTSLPAGARCPECGGKSVATSP